ncbi:hypothetical protein RPO_07480 [Rickettsia rickettsii str. Arizona]|uniref:Uncharacterized protein n=1 Tax=Rickettsia rickettsii (strain Iowa) TaxID=452659 RepID=B0BVP0_RICRO|nr:hypothetical protein RrIowa_1584 [Rickettsia rickettsii str. Iowa]AFB25607.1 hypothetical protein RPO_07480 [Rickettsia rickettsii str. Arizona]AFB28287.1 hypothetical protein RPJ_07445 [Rickettsia rickettsii str. Hino]AFB30948.1 hypothetical protein RPM_07455 [Rickettsia rickettsii str. Hauke]APU56246.1 hypothetical protein BTU50_1584 [Rickettsia rickettsii]
MLAEQQTEWIISNNLVNKGWHIDNDIKKSLFPKTTIKNRTDKIKRKKTGSYLI